MKHALQVLLLTCAGTSLALAQASIEGERWKITSKMQMQGMSLPGSSSEICKQAGAEGVPIKTDDNCQIYDMQRTGNVQSFKMRCTGKDAVEGSAQFTYLGTDRYQGKMTMTTQGETMTMDYEGQKLGKCDGSEINFKVKEMQAEANKQMANAEKVQLEQCHKLAADATSPQIMLTLCKDPADLRTFCSAVRTHEKFRSLAEMEAQAQGNEGSKPLSESAQLCGFTVEAQRVQLCGSAEAQEKLDFVVSQCPLQSQALAQAQCAGRKYTAISDKYRNFCSNFASNEQREARQAEETGVAGKTKGLFNKSKKALGGIFSN